MVQEGEDRFMNKEKKGRSVWMKLLTLVAAFSMTLSMAPTVHAQESAQKTYVALGDSISTGYAVTEGVKFTDKVAADNELSLASMASDGETSGTLLAKLKDPATAAAVMKADVITITVGGNDFMNALYSFLETAYLAANPDALMTTEQIRDSLLNGNMQMVAFAAGVLPDFASSAEIQTAAKDFTANLGQILAGIRAANPDVSLIVATQYNPYTNLAAQLAGNPLFAGSASAINEAFETGVTLLNGVIRKAAEQTGAYVADVYTAFRSAVAVGENPCNASFAMMKLNLDFHPNAAGHTIIAGLVNEILAGIPVQPELTYSVEVTPAGAQFGEAAEGYDVPEAENFTVTNNGTGELANLSVTLTGEKAENFILDTADMKDTLNAGESTTFTAVPKEGLAAGTYEAAIAVSADHMETPAYAGIRFVVKEAPICGHVAEADDGDCTTEVICSLCGEMLTPAKDSHSFGEWTSRGDGTHSRACTNEGCTVTETENCSGGTAQIGKKPVCTVCGGEYGEALKEEDKPETDAGKDTGKETWKDEDKEGKDEPKKNGEPAAPVTGDAADPILWLALLMVSCGAAGGVAVSRRRS